jgi:hypothetical protein
MDENIRLKVAFLAPYGQYFSKGDELNVAMPADLDQFR